MPGEIISIRPVRLWQKYTEKCRIRRLYDIYCDDVSDPRYKMLSLYVTFDQESAWDYYWKCTFCENYLLIGKRWYPATRQLGRHGFGTFTIIGQFHPGLPLNRALEQFKQKQINAQEITV